MWLFCLPNHFSPPAYQGSAQQSSLICKLHEQILQPPSYFEGGATRSRLR
jgi:hypothetical protein